MCARSGAAVLLCPPSAPMCGCELGCGRVEEAAHAVVLASLPAHAVIGLGGGHIAARKATDARRRAVSASASRGVARDSPERAHRLPTTISHNARAPSLSYPSFSFPPHTNYVPRKGHDSLFAQLGYTAAGLTLGGTLFEGRETENVDLLPPSPHTHRGDKQRKKTCKTA